MNVRSATKESRAFCRPYPALQCLVDFPEGTCKLRRTSNKDGIRTFSSDIDLVDAKRKEIIAGYQGIC